MKQTSYILFILYYFNAYDFIYFCLHLILINKL